MTPLAAEMPAEPLVPALPGSARARHAALPASPGHGRQLPARLLRGWARCHHPTQPLPTGISSVMSPLPRTVPSIPQPLETPSVSPSGTLPFAPGRCPAALLSPGAVKAQSSHLFLSLSCAQRRQRSRAVLAVQRPGQRAADGAGRSL